MKNYRNIIFTGALLLCFMYGTAQAEEYKALNIEPGNYEFNDKSTSTQTPDEKVRKYERCIKDGKLDPAGDMAKRKGCEVSNYKSKGDKISFDFVCKNERAASTVRGRLAYSGSGKEFAYKKSVKTEIAEGQEFSIESSGTAVRKGDCS